MRHRMNKPAARVRAATLLPLALACLLAVPPRAEAGLPRGELLGIRLGMTEAEATARMSKLGRPNATMPAPKQGWELDDSRYAHLIVRYDGNHLVKWVTVLAREDGPRVRYRDIGDVKKAARSGFYFYTWTVPPKKTRAGYVVVARGTDPEFLSSLSLAPFTPPLDPRARSGAPKTGR